MKHCKTSIDAIAESDCSAEQSHHHMLAVETQLQPVTYVQRSRNPVPIAAIYDLEKIAERQCETTAKPVVAEKVSHSMFFKRQAGKLDQDPFLQRLSRLN